MTKVQLRPADRKDYAIKHSPLLRRLALLSLAVLSGVSDAAPKILIIATSELPPYVSANPQNSFLTELLPKVGNEMGVTFKFRFMPWQRCERSVEDLQVWATMPYVPTPERNEKFLFSQPLYAKKTVFFFYSPSSQDYPQTFDNLEELQRFKIGGVRGYYYETMLIAAGLRVELTTSEESNFKKLSAKRVDMAVAVDTVGWEIIRNTFSPEEQSNFRELETPLTVGHNYLMTSRNYPQTEQLLVRFNLALAKLRRNGIYRQIAERHGIEVDN